ncbi:MAG: hypothetical protein AB7P08_03000 [Burkholderiales bacterium]
MKSCRRFPRLPAFATLAILSSLPAVAADPADCGGFSAGDAAPFVGAGAAQVVRKVEKLTPTLWTCSYAAGRKAPAVVFNVEAAADPKKAAGELERYRENLAVAGGTAAFKDRLPQGAYSDIMGVGDEAVWTDVNGALTVRKGRFTIQVTMPRGKLAQLKLARAVVAKF